MKMKNDINAPKLLFPDYFNDRVAEEMTVKGWYPADIVFDNGFRLSLEFFGPVRLHQDIVDELIENPICFAQNNIIVLPKVTIENINIAIEYLWGKGYFSKFSPGII